MVCVVFFSYPTLFIRVSVHVVRIDETSVCPQHCALLLFMTMRCRLLLHRTPLP